MRTGSGGGRVVAAAAAAVASLIVVFLVEVLVGLLVGPMFVVLEMLAPLGLFRGLMADIERHAGPTFIRDLAHPVAR